MVSNALPFVTRLWWTFRWEVNTSGLPECRFAFSSSLPPGYWPFNIVSKDSTTTLFLVIKSGKVVMLRCASCTPRNNRSISIITPIFMLKETSRQALQKPFIFSSRLSQSWCLIAFFSSASVWKADFLWQLWPNWRDAPKIECHDAPEICMFDFQNFQIHSCEQNVSSHFYGVQMHDNTEINCVLRTILLAFHVRYIQEIFSIIQQFCLCLRFLHL